MSALNLTADGHGNVVAAVTVSTSADVAHVVELAPGRTMIEIGADEPVQLCITGPVDVLRAVLTDALEQLLHLEVGQ